MTPVSNPIAKLVAGCIFRSNLSPEECLRMFDITSELRYLVQYELEALRQQYMAGLDTSQNVERALAIREAAR